MDRQFDKRRTRLEPGEFLHIGGGYGQLAHGSRRELLNQFRLSHPAQRVASAVCAVIVSAALAAFIDGLARS
ncbi:hypothetical protein GCM10027034_31380 [Ramlibacter solisilvae]|uniref:Uncharacterized protein n=1 Tax=Ramlibacter tataouinensis TaxID=94132 RepID=A0A127JRM5_9BURK|nr:hypothetical protein [Ramlibacter tataouinensis]AMO22684.1 hypothetical protein UC35_07060 [Ramlibacter tataouinensis]